MNYIKYLALLAIFGMWMPSEMKADNHEATKMEEKENSGEKKKLGGDNGKPPMEKKKLGGDAGKPPVDKNDEKGVLGKMKDGMSTVKNKVTGLFK